MESTGKNDKLSKRYSSGVVACRFLLALLWPLGNFVFWILDGAISYFVFLLYINQKLLMHFGRGHQTDRSESVLFSLFQRN